METRLELYFLGTGISSHGGLKWLLRGVFGDEKDDVYFLLGERARYYSCCCCYCNYYYYMADLCVLADGLIQLAVVTVCTLFLETY